MRVEADAAKCIASGQCVLNAPGVFDQGTGGGTVVLLDESPAAEHHDAVREAAMVCPSGAITVQELRCAWRADEPVLVYSRPEVLVVPINGWRDDVWHRITVAVFRYVSALPLNVKTWLPEDVTFRHLTHDQDRQSRPPHPAA
jgi:ferredoxin